MVKKEWSVVKLQVNKWKMVVKKLFFTTIFHLFTCNGGTVAVAKTKSCCHSPGQWHTLSHYR